MLSCAATQHYIPSGSERLMCTTGCLMPNTFSSYMLVLVDEAAHIASRLHSARLCQRPIVGVKKLNVWSVG